jgi:hypothetical protein
MDTTRPAGHLRLSLMVIMVMSFCGGGFAILAFQGFLHATSTYQPVMQAIVAVLFVGVSLLHVRKICGFIR